MSGAIVSHPHVAAFSAGVAAAMARAGRLTAYFTGMAFAEGSVSSRLAATLAARYPVARNRIVADVPPPLLRSLQVVELGSRAAAKLQQRLGGRTKAYDIMFPAHDRAVSLMPWPKGTKAVYAYEDAALWTFRRARRNGLECFWDLPLPHYLAIEETMLAEAQRWPTAVLGRPHREPEWKRSRKDEELATATTIVAASAFTKRSLERLTLGGSTIVVPYGFPVETFTPRSAAPEGPFTVLAVGSHDLRKGTPYLLEAWGRAAIPNAQLHLIGPMRLGDSFLAPHRGTFRHTPHLAKSELESHYKAADLLAFPTLGDGFGLVIQEAMCCGTPVLTTPCGGGPECITDGVDGWIVPPRDVDALVDRLREAAAGRDRLFAMGQRARARAERWTWADAGRALVGTLFPRGS
jgi:glycosyltransferase involved in cell wall biosynthesis